jgi:hypothetical protein
MGIYIEFLPNTLGVHMPYNKVTTYDCLIRQRLSGGHEGWWNYGETELDAIESIERMKDSFLSNGLPYFSNFKDFPMPLSNITIDDIEKGSPKFKILGFLPTKIGFSLVISQVHLHEGNFAVAIKFANWA